MAIVGSYFRFITDVATLQNQINVLDAETPRPLFAMTGITPLPTGIVVPISPGFVDIAVFAETIDDRSDLTIISGGQYFQVAGEIFNQNATVRVTATLALTMEDVSGAAGNIRWDVNAITGTNLGTGSEVIIEDTIAPSQVTNNLRVFLATFTELFDLPGLQVLGLANLQFGLRLSHNAGAGRTIDALGLEVGFRQVDVL